MEEALNEFQISPYPILFDLLKFEHHQKFQNIKFFLKANLTISNLTDNYLIYEFKIHKNYLNYYSVDPNISILFPKLVSQAKKVGLTSTRTLTVKFSLPSGTSIDCLPNASITASAISLLARSVTFETSPLYISKTFAFLCPWSEAAENKS